VDRILRLMKHYNTLWIILSLLSTPALAQQAETLKTRILDINNPGSRIEVFCKEAACANLHIVKYHADKVDHEVSITRAELEKRADQVLVRETQEGGEPYRAYYITKTTVVRAKDHWKRGYKGKSILESILLIGTSVVDTILLPASPVIYVASTTRPYKDQKRGAILLRSYIDTGDTEIQLLEKHFQKLWYKIY
jgi:hypothetical protein